MLSNQSMFDECCTHVIKHKNEFTVMSNGGCSYRDDDGRMCVKGWFKFRGEVNLLIELQQAHDKACLGPHDQFVSKFRELATFTAHRFNLSTAVQQ